MAALILVALMAAGLFVLVFRSPPLSYSGESYAPERTIVNPGETLYYTPTLTVRQGGYIKIVRSFWNVDMSQAATDCDGAAVPSVVVERALPRLLAGEVRGNIVKLEVPSLPPGRYQLVSAAVGANGGQTWYYVPFEVDQPCG
jgi:hypothetical protein